MNPAPGKMSANNVLLQMSGFYITVANRICGKIRQFSAISGVIRKSLRFPGFSMGRKCPSGFTQGVCKQHGFEGRKLWSKIIQ